MIGRFADVFCCPARFAASDATTADSINPRRLIDMKALGLKWKEEYHVDLVRSIATSLWPWRKRSALCGDGFPERIEAPAATQRYTSTNVTRLPQNLQDQQSGSEP